MHRIAQALHSTPVEKYGVDLQQHSGRATVEIYAVADRLEEGGNSVKGAIL